MSHHRGRLGKKKDGVYRTDSLDRPQHRTITSPPPDRDVVHGVATCELVPRLQLGHRLVAASRPIALYHRSRPQLGELLQKFQQFSRAIQVGLADHARQ
jgi:hypothetical protein